MATPTVRLYEPGDEVAINQAFNRVFGKSRTLEEWVWKYATDIRPKPIIAAWDGAVLAAHNGGIPADFEVGGNRVKALQGADTLALAAVERRPEWRDAWQRVMNFFAEVARDRLGVSLLYGFTGGRAIGHMVHRAHWDSVPPRPIPLLIREGRPSGRSLASRFFRAHLVDDHEPALDLLWDRARHRYAAAVVRDAAHASRRLSGHPSVQYHRFLVAPRFSSAPAAFAAFRTDGGVCRWIDLVWDGRHPGALELVDHLSRRLAEQYGCGREELWLDGDPEVTRWLSAFGFSGGPDPSGVVRVVRFLDENLNMEAFTPGSVYTTMADADLV